MVGGIASLELRVGFGEAKRRGGRGVGLGANLWEEVRADDGFQLSGNSDRSINK